MHDRIKEVQEKMDSIIETLSGNGHEVTKEHVISIAEAIKSLTWEMERLQEEVNSLYSNE